MFPEPVLQRAQHAVERLADQERTLAVAESCTGGLLAGAVTAVTGASHVFHGGVVAYTEPAKRRLLGLEDEDLLQGPVSDAVTGAMALAVRDRAGADVALAVTGWAEDGPAVPGGEAGLVLIALSGPGSEAQVRGHRFRGGRHHVRLKAVDAALALLLRELSLGAHGGRDPEKD